MRPALIIAMTGACICLSCQSAGHSTAERASPRAANPRLAASLIGTWRLVEFWDRESASAPRQYLYGEQPTGYFVYDPTGRVAILIMKGPNPPIVKQDRGENWFRSASLEELRETIGAFRAYFGSYNVDPDRGVVVHQVEGDNRALYTGTRQTRRFRLAGDSLDYRQ